MVDWRYYLPWPGIEVARINCGEEAKYTVLPGLGPLETSRISAVRPYY